MRAVRYHRWGPPEVLQLDALPRPEPRRGQLLVEVQAAAVNPKDCLLRKGRYKLFAGRRFPKLCGADFAGRVVHRSGEFEAGTEIYGMLGGFQGGSFSEYLSVSPRQVARRPASLDWAECAAIPLAAQTALQALRNRAGLRPGQRVCINGASGGVGCFAVQIAKLLGAEVTAVCSAANRELVLGLGADEHLDYHDRSIELEHGRFDVFFDVFGNKRLAVVAATLKRRGVYVSTVPAAGVLFDVLTSWWRARRGSLVLVRSKRADLELLADWVDTGGLRPVIDSRFSFSQAAEAHRRVETKRARGKVVLEGWPQHSRS